MTTIAIFPNIVIYDFDPITFIGSSYREISFYINCTSCGSLDISTATARWDLVSYDFTDYVALSKTGIISGSYFMVKLLDTDTKYLSGKYIQRPTLISDVGYQYKLGQGIVNIIPRIGSI
ncbi:MAG: hypothetical protein M0Q12_05725 [Synergistaceae bacterium]|jgi:hypothetical protein|nr:hypothetical protein [Synergistaceae bacterium]